MIVRPYLVSCKWRGHDQCNFSKEPQSPLRHSGNQPIKVRKRPIEGGQRPVNANASWWKTAPLKRPMKRSMTAEGAP